jgi:GT2 family glycosyltransferase
MKVSIVLTAYRRAKQLKNTIQSIASQTHKDVQIIVVEDGYDGGATQGVCIEAKNERLPVEYYQRRRRPNLDFSNPAIPKNIGIRKAVGEILIVQCAEVMYTTPDDLANLIAPVEADPMVSSFALAKALNEDGSFREWYAGPERCAGWFLDFCQAVRREAVINIGGFDEGFQGYGFEDDDFSFRLQKSGIKYQWNHGVIVHHQWHAIADKIVGLSENGRARYNQMTEDVNAGRRSFRTNEDRKFWGDVDL